MPRLQIVVAFLAGILVAFVAGLVPPEVIASLREWAGRPGPDPDAGAEGETTAGSSAKRKRIPRKARR